MTLNIRYLFNCGEGTQRLCTQHKVKITKLKNVFLTRIHWECMGGLPGMLLTLADVGLTNIKIHGGDNLTHALTATRNFLLRTSMSVTTREFPVEGSSFQDENMTIKQYHSGRKLSRRVQLKRKFRFQQNENTTKLYLITRRRYCLSCLIRLDMDQSMFEMQLLRLQYEDAVTETHALLESNESSNYLQKPDNLVNERRELYSRRLPKSKPNPISIAYICKGPDYKGKFNPKSAKALGLKPGPLYAQLADGQSVTAPDGTIVHPHQVLGPSRPGAITIIVDVPSVNYIQSLINSQEFGPYQSGDENFRPRVIIHMVGNGVLEDERYQSWMREFGDETEHLITGETCNAQRIMFNSAALSQLKLSKIDSNHFRVPFYSNRPQKSLSDISNLPAKAREAEPKLIYQTEPVAQLDTSQIVSDFGPNQALLTDDALWKEYLKTVEIKNEIQSTKLDLAQFPGNDVIVTTLGTGSALSSKYRNVSGTIITIPSCGSIILDAGEGTLG
ncbi:5201_t:CDS:2 [Paraglomus brasilianum]|uniref:ribonuclease Z n=1 Tax=Paraglomus brasilianum TaxID=144538 RepID=A0A9N9CB67_9GLOM|nr:5201_t:CDS:2 [Paraglomus brasilianum]